MSFTENMSFQDHELKVYLVYKNEDNSTASEDMQQAVTYLNDYVSAENIKWVHEREALGMVSDGKLTKKDVFVLEEFAGDVFDDLQKTKCLVVGPRCMLVCLLECVPIPLGTSPIFITSMRDLYISCSGFDNAQKLKIKNLVSYMGGYYQKDLHFNCNYLISNTIKSKKYEQAVMNSIPVMLSTWVDAVWEMGKTQTILATDSIFEKYKLPVFYEVNITVSGLPTDQKNLVVKAIIENGGNYQKSFKSSTTDILISTKDTTHSDKFKAAARYKKDILCPEWIFDSVSKGSALPFQKYKIKSIQVSTPNKNEHSFADFTANYTQMSEISKIDGSDPRSNITVDESILAPSTSGISKPLTRSGSSLAATYKDILMQLSPQLAKKSGTFLDGCCVYLSGFTPEEKEKLNKILNIGGATRYNEVNEKVTHIIVGQMVASEITGWREQGIESGGYIVTLDWLMESINSKQPANELNYRAKLPINREPEAPSPQSKKSIRSMNHSFKKPSGLPKKRLNFSEKQNVDLLNEGASVFADVPDVQEPEFLSHYSEENNMSAANLSLPGLPPAKSKKENKIENMEPPKSSNLTAEDTMSTADYENLNFFDGLTVYVDKNYEEDIYSQAVVDCETALGRVVTATYRDRVDYVIVSAEMPIDVNKIPVRSKHIVNAIWMEDAIRTNELVKIEYFHKPISILAAMKPLTGMTIAISGYSQSERMFLQSLVAVLGATCRDAYVRKERPLLVCPSPTTAKYNAALKWQYPAVNCEWLVRCSESGKIEPMESYLVGDTIVGDFLSSTEQNTSKSNVSMLDIPKSTKDLSIRSKNSVKPLVESKEIIKLDANISTEEPGTLEYTPLRHKRIAELAGPSNRTPNYSDEHPTTPKDMSSDSRLFGDLDEFLKDIPSDDVRELCKNVLLEAENYKTPELERLKRLARTPNNSKSPATPQGIPEFCKTPEFRKRMLEYADKRWHLSIKRLKCDTPLKQIKNRLWRETLPAEFVATCKYFQIDLEELEKDSAQLNTSSSPAVVEKNTSALSINSDGSNFENTSPAVKRLQDFLKNCEKDRSENSSKVVAETAEVEEQTQSLPQRFESEMMFNSERMVGWGDRADFCARRPAMKYQGKPKFILSSFTHEEISELQEKIVQLQGTVSENLINYDPTCTHVVCEKPNRGEKLLSSAASGKWIISANFVRDSFNAGYFLDEELYEWGNPMSSKNQPTISQNEQKIANAFYCWRCKLQKNTQMIGAFTGQKILLHVPEKSIASFTNVLTAGNGVILQGKTPYDKSLISKATHCYVDNRKCQLSKTDHKNLIDSGVYVVDLFFISTYLTSDPEANIINYTLSL